jgi:hypothetical protein
MPPFAAPSYLRLADQRETLRRLKKRANIFQRPRSGRLPCSEKRSAHLKKKLPMQSLWQWQCRPKATPLIEPVQAPKAFPKPEVRRFSTGVGAASLSQQRGVVWDDGGEGAIDELARPPANEAMSLRWFAQLGLVSLQAHHAALQPAGNRRVPAGHGIFTPWVNSAVRMTGRKQWAIMATTGNS